MNILRIEIIRNEEEEKKEWIEKSIKIDEYQRKFLNREFTALKDEPREE